MPLRRLLLLLAAGMVAMPGASEAGPRAVIELFTSQGCSSCPPADRVLGELAADPSVIAISLPVDYWDYLGWKDTLASPDFSARQRAYSLTRGDRRVYTPQVVVNGTAHVLGSDRNAIERAIGQTRRNAMTVPVTIAASGSDFTVSVPERDGGIPCEVWLLGVSRAVPVGIRRGENSGRTVTYHNVARTCLKLGEWSGNARSWTVPAQKIGDEGIDIAAVILQAGSFQNPGPVLGAAAVDLR